MEIVKIGGRVKAVYQKLLIGFCIFTLSGLAYAKIPEDLRMTLNGRNTERFFNVRIRTIGDLSNRHNRQAFTTFIGACHAVQVQIFGLNDAMAENWPIEMRKERSLLGKLNWNVAVAMFRLYERLEETYPEETAFWKWFNFGSDKMSTVLFKSRVSFKERDINLLLARHNSLLRYKKHCVAQLKPSLVEELSKSEMENEVNSE